MRTKGNEGVPICVCRMNENQKNRLQASDMAAGHLQARSAVNVNNLHRAMATSRFGLASTPPIGPLWWRG